MLETSPLEPSTADRPRQHEREQQAAPQSSRLDRLLGPPIPMPREDCLPPQHIREALTPATQNSASLPTSDVATASVLVAFTAAFLTLAVVNLSMSLFSLLVLVVPAWDYAGPASVAGLLCLAGLSAYKLARRAWKRHNPDHLGACAITLVMAIVVAAVCLMLPI